MFMLIYHFSSVAQLCLTLQSILPFYEVLELAEGEGNGTPLQYSCLENPMDGGAR